MGLFSPKPAYNDGVKLLPNPGGASTASISGKAHQHRHSGRHAVLHWGNPALAPQVIPSRFILEVQETDVLPLGPTLRAQVPPVTGKNRIKLEMLEDIIVLHFSATTS
jgi:hypothetical protein